MRKSSSLAGFAALSLGVLALGVLSLAGTPLAAQVGAPQGTYSPEQELDRWMTEPVGDSCNLSYASADGSFLFAIEVGPNGDYAARVYLFGDYVNQPASDGEIAISAGDDRIWIVAEQAVVLEQVNDRGQHPAESLFALGTANDQLRLESGGFAETMSVNNFAEARAAFESCMAASASDAATGPRGPVLIAFEGLNQLAAEASRQAMLSQVLGFTLTIDAEGKPTQCELDRDFRRRATEIALCRPLLRYHRFEPAIDAQGNPVEGRYRSQIDFRMWMGEDGYLEPESR